MKLFGNRKPNTKRLGAALGALALLTALLLAGCGSLEDLLQAARETDAPPQSTLYSFQTAGDSASGAGETGGQEGASPEGAQAEETSASGDASGTEAPQQGQQSRETPCPIEESGSYFSKDQVALYLHIYGRLPENFITKQEARALGWEGGSVQKYAPGKAIGGDSFGNYEGLLPKAKGRSYCECDIDTDGKASRGAKRILYSNDGLIYYTGDHYQSFTLLYGEP